MNASVDWNDDVLGLLAGAISATAAYSHGRARKRALSGHLAQIGRDYDNGLMIVGRCLNGGINDSKWHTHQPISMNEAKRQAYICANETNDFPTRLTAGEKNPDYRVESSKFWGAAKLLVHGISGSATEDWDRMLAWTNLYKIAPRDEGNPSDGLCAKQHEMCAQILPLEVAALKPKFIVFLTDEDWLRWFRTCDPKLPLSRSRGAVSRDVTDVGTFVVDGHEAKYVVATRPDSRRKGASLDGWSGEVLAALKEP